MNGLAEDLVPTLITYFVVFSRAGAILMMMPALGEAPVPQPVRLAIALAICLLIYPVVAENLPSGTLSAPALFLVVIREVVIGLLIGALMRFTMIGLNVAGGIIAYQSGLALAQGFDPTQGTQGAMLSTFLTLMGITVIFAADLHLLLIQSISSSYELFPVGGAIKTGEFADAAVTIFAQSFALGIQMSAPFIAYGLIFYAGLGLLSRLMPQLQVFFIAMPLNILFGFTVLALVLGAIMTLFADYFQSTIEQFVR